MNSIMFGAAALALCLCVACAPQKAPAPAVSEIAQMPSGVAGAELPGEFQGTFERVNADGSTNELATVSVDRAAFSLGDEGRNLQGAIERVEETDGSYTLSVRGSYRLKH